MDKRLNRIQELLQEALVFKRNDNMSMGWFITILGLVLAAIGTFFMYYGQSILNTKESSTTTSISQRTLSPQAEKLLSLVYKYQRDLGLNKLVIGRKGNLAFDEEEKRKKYKINFIGELFDIKSDYASRAKEFENIMLSIPSDFLKTIPETRLDSPYVVSITQEGIAYLKKD